ncbi:transposase [Candidatus Nomurabacteria bacterium]|jgi:putative transposase|nr:transposase [Candidatus Saccharibacteria bacterium]MCB9821997.1 transposase [Candidatus Nomurabacteria bacterium]
MPVRNTIRFDVDECFYHVYNRGINKQIIFHDDDDKEFFINLLARYLAPESVIDQHGNIYKTYNNKLELLCYCLMDNHFHLMFYQNEKGVLKDYMQSIANSYIRYFNTKYERRGPLFESRYKSSLIETQPYLEHITRYIHLNPKDWQTYKYSSLPYYLNEESPEWFKPEKILELFDGESYLEFMKDYEDHKAMLDEIKYELAD